jgi:putative holliday junction resolvase
MEEIHQDRILAIDFGLKRVGLALSDPLKIFSYPFMTIPYNNEFIQKLSFIVKENSVSKIILGYPVSLKGEKTSISDEILKVKTSIEKIIKIEVLLWDERFTSEMAKQMVLESTPKKSKRRDKGLLDQNSASIILQEYLNIESRRRNKPDELIK